MKSAVRAGMALYVRNLRVRYICFFKISISCNIIMGVFLLLDPCWFVHLSNLSCLIVLDTTKSPTHSYHHPLPNNIEYRGHNYRVISGNLSWYNAMVMCRENHFDLVSIMDAYHQAFLTVLVNRLGAPHWIGLHSELAVCILHEKCKCFVSLVCCCSFLL